MSNFMLFFVYFNTFCQRLFIGKLSSENISTLYLGYIFA